jgi:hypothetical protein
MTRYSSDPGTCSIVSTEIPAQNTAPVMHDAKTAAPCHRRTKPPWMNAVVLSSTYTIAAARPKPSVNSGAEFINHEGDAAALVGGGCDTGTVNPYIDPPDQTQIIGKGKHR